MQRFKKHFCNELGQYSGGHPHMNTNGKFVYGANGTLTHAARDRTIGLTILNHTHDCAIPPGERKKLIKTGRQYIQYSKSAGCTLP